MKLLRHLEKLNKNNFFRIFKPIGAVLIGTLKASFCPNCSSVATVVKMMMVPAPTQAQYRTTCLENFVVNVFFHMTSVT